VVCAHVERTPRRRIVSSAAPQPDIARTGHPHGQPAHHAHVASKKRRAVGALSFLPTEQAVWASAGANTRHSGQLLRKQCPANRARTAETDVKGDASMPHPILRAETIPHVPGESLRPCRRCRATSVPLRPPTQTDRPSPIMRPPATSSGSPPFEGRGRGRGFAPEPPHSRDTPFYPQTGASAGHHPPPPTITRHPRKHLFSAMLGCSGPPAPAPGTASCYLCTLALSPLSS
jgi:hypothetical protein